MHGVVVIGEGEKDDAPMLFNGEQVGDGTGPECDVAVDPIDGTTLTAKGMTNAIVGAGGAPSAARCTTRPRSSTWRSSSPARRPPTSSTSAPPVGENIRAGRQGQGRARRGRHRRASSTGRATRSWSSEIRETGARIKFITDGDVAGAIMAARDGTGIDLLLGIGGTPEGIIAACAMKCLGGVIQGRLWPKDDEERQQGARRRPRPRPRAARPTTSSPATTCFFVATGITDGELLAGRPLPRRRRDHPLAGDALARAAPSARSRASTG